MLTFKTLEKAGLANITATFNAAFADYFLPVSITETKLAHKMATEGGRLDISAGIYDNGNLVALMLHFTDNIDGKKYCYNGGTAVIPAYRGRQLTSGMYQFILPKLQHDGVDTLVLEVLTQNIPAIKAYQRQGFNKVRELSCYRGKINPSPCPLARGFILGEISSPDLCTLQTFCDFEPSWQNTFRTIEKQHEQLKYFCISKNDNIAGYLVYNLQSRRIHQLAVHKDYRNLKLATCLLNHLQSIEQEPISIINIDEDCQPLKQLLQKSGFENYTNQYEMIMQLNK